ncbi:hypothetical protein JW911_01360 [Candidatus Peregrinibacteria bacterium]|nr:hypothetical protein [Candidatus Peregrinibacteria bacterium]
MSEKDPSSLENTEMYMKSCEQLTNMQAALEDILKFALEIKDYPEDDIKRSVVLLEINDKLKEVMICYQGLDPAVFNTHECSVFELLNYQNCKNLSDLILKISKALGIVEFNLEKSILPKNYLQEGIYIKITNLLECFITQPSLERLIELYKKSFSYLMTDPLCSSNAEQKQRLEFCITFNNKLREHIIGTLNEGPAFLDNNTAYIIQAFWRTFKAFFGNSKNQRHYGAD